MEHYAIVGSWTELPGIDMGITIFRVNGTEFVKQNSYFPEVKVGACVYDVQKSVLYFVDEVQHTDDRSIGGGGYIYAAHFDCKTGTIKLLNRIPSFGVKPDFCAFDEDRKHLIVVHYGSTRDTVTTLYRDERGKIRNRVIYDDIPTVLFRLNEDGSIGEACDYFLHPGVNPVHDNPAHIHSVYRSPRGNVFILSDKGMDRIYSFRMNGDRLDCINMLNVELESDPRYGVFHPTLPLFYGTNEKKRTLSVYRYDEINGISEKIADVPVLDGTECPEKKVTASDVVIDKEAKHLYLALRHTNRLVCLELNDDGIPSLKQSIEMGGNNTRGLSLNPEGNRIYCCNCMSDLISVFHVDETGILHRTTEDIQVNCPGNILFVEKED